MNIDVREDDIENDDDIVITNHMLQQDILVCFQTKAMHGAYKTVMKYNLFRLVKEIGCDLWAPLDIRKPFKLVEKTNKKCAKKLKAIGEIKQECAWWGIYHPFQLRHTISKLEIEKNKINSCVDSIQKEELNKNFYGSCVLLKLYLFEDEDDTEMFLDKYPQFWL